MPLTTKQIVIIAYAAYLVLLSLITFIAYGVDKKKAEKGKYRTKEKTLLLLSFLKFTFHRYFYPQISIIILFLRTHLNPVHFQSLNASFQRSRLKGVSPEPIFLTTLNFPF